MCGLAKDLISVMWSLDRSLSAAAASSSAGMASSSAASASAFSTVICSLSILSCASFSPAALALASTSTVLVEMICTRTSAQRVDGRAAISSYCGRMALLAVGWVVGGGRRGARQRTDKQANTRP